MSPATKIDIPKISKLNSFESKAKTIKVKLKIMGVAATTWNTFLEFWIDPKKAESEINKIYGNTSLKKSDADFNLLGSS